MKINKIEKNFLDKDMTKVILSVNLMELSSPQRKRGFRKRAADPSLANFHHIRSSEDRRAL